MLVTTLNSMPKHNSRQQQHPNKLVIKLLNTEDSTRWLKWLKPNDLITNWKHTVALLSRKAHRGASLVCIWVTGILKWVCCSSFEIILFFNVIVQDKKETFKFQIKTFFCVIFYLPWIWSFFKQSIFLMINEESYFITFTVFLENS